MLDKKVRVIRVNLSFVKCKIYAMVVCIFLDLFFNTFIEFNLDLNLTNRSKDQNVYIAFMGVQVFWRILLMMFFILLLWSTFVFAHGMVREIVRNFKWTFLVIFLDLILHIMERAIRVSQINKAEDEIWSNGFYTILYFLKYSSKLHLTASAGRDLCNVSECKPEGGESRVLQARELDQELLLTRS